VLANGDCSADLNIISSSNIGSRSQGAVGAKVISASEIEISVALASGVKFVNSGEGCWSHPAPEQRQDHTGPVAGAH
jgi:hypothetical protein